MFRYTKVSSISIIFMSLNSIPIAIFYTRMRCYLAGLFSFNQFIKTYFSSTITVNSVRYSSHNRPTLILSRA
jgi:hypothetical protein